MTNLNTASIDELKSLEGIGTHRATAIIILRYENRYITMEDIKKNLITVHPQYKNVLGNLTGISGIN